MPVDRDPQGRPRSDSPRRRFGIKPQTEQERKEKARGRDQKRREKKKD